MTKKVNKCMVCGKPNEGSGSICQACNESIRGEAAGKRKKVTKEADKHMTRHGQKPPTEKQG